MPACALGLRVHSGWAALVAIEASLRGRVPPRVLVRRRLEIADPAIPGSRQPYHEAEEMPLPEASRYLGRCERASLRLAKAGLADAVASLPDGADPSRCVILLASGRPLPELAKVLASHALIHTADGEHFRDALAAAASARGLDVVRVRERDAAAELGSKTGRSPEDVRREIDGWRKELGVPWTADQKLAAIAAWISIA